MKHMMGFLKAVSLCLGLVVLSVALCGAQAQSSTLKYEGDPTWPKPLPVNRKVSHAQLGHHCCRHGVGGDSKRFMELTKRLGDIRDHWDQRQWD
jgi:hypothetical protein